MSLYVPIPGLLRACADAGEKVKRGDLFATITHPTEGPATVKFTDDPEPYNSSATVDKLGTLGIEMGRMGAVLGGMEQALSLHEAWLKEVGLLGSPRRW